MPPGAAIARAPLVVRVLDGLVHRLLRVGVPMGPNALLTVRGRKSGQPRTTGVALVEIGGRRWVISVYGDVHWARNLRAAGEAELCVRGRNEAVLAEELDRDAAAAFYRDTLVAYVGSLSPPVRMAARVFARPILADPEGSAGRIPVFELHR